MASLTQRHSKNCKGFPGAVLGDQVKPAGCTCEPSYYLVVSTERDGKKKLDRKNVGKNRREAQLALAVVRGEQAKGEYRPLENITFNEWADRWKASLLRPKQNTLRSYVATLDYAKAAFGDKLVRKLGANDVETFLGLVSGGSPSTAAKHLRVLSACLRAAVKRGYAAANPIENLSASERPTPTKRESAYFESDELPRLFAEVREWDRPLFMAALKTGMRQGELIALTWGDVLLMEGTIRVRRIYVPGIGVTIPKSHAGKRDVAIPNGAQEVFKELLKDLGQPPSDDALVFPGRNGYRHGSNLTRQLYEAMDRAGIPRVGPTGEKRTFHSLRHTYAKTAIENGTQLLWLQRQLGHSSLKVTADTYGHFETAAGKREAEKLDGAFPV